MPLKTSLADPQKIDLTSMIDVVFLLIIFFMVGSKFTEIERTIELQVPTVSDNPTLTAAPEKKVINIFRTGEITLDSESVTLDMLTARLAEAHDQYTGLGVLVRGDAEGQFQTVADVLNACKLAGVVDLAISVNLAQKRR